MSQWSINVAEQWLADDQGWLVHKHHHTDRIRVSGTHIVSLVIRIIYKLFTNILLLCVCFCLFQCFSLFFNSSYESYLWIWIILEKMGLTHILYRCRTQPASPYFARSTYVSLLQNTYLTFPVHLSAWFTSPPDFLHRLPSRNRPYHNLENISVSTSFPNFMAAFSLVPVHL